MSTDALHASLDKLARAPFCRALERLLFAENKLVDGSLVVSLTAPFGSGKTTFLEHWVSDLKTRRDSASLLPVAILVNAWETDFCGDPLISIVSGLLKSRAVIDNEPKKASALREAASDIAHFSLGLANELVAHTTGIDVLAAADHAEDKKRSRIPPKSDFVALHDNRLDALRKFKKELSSLFGSDQPKAIIMIDELDRCRPDYAVTYLETIKHLFDIKGIIFVLAMDPDQMANVVEALFGKINTPEYFRKFIHRSVALPQPTQEAALEITAHYTARFVENCKTLIPLQIKPLIPWVTELTLSFAMTQRQVQEMFRVFSYSLSFGEPGSGRESFGYVLGSLLMAMLRVVDFSMYKQIGAVTVDNKMVAMFFNDKFGHKNSRKWVFYYLAGTGKTDRAELMNYLRLPRNTIDRHEHDLFNEWHECYTDWGRPSINMYPLIFQRIEQLRALDRTV